MKTYYDHLIDEMPHGLDRAVLRIVSQYHGRANPIKRIAIIDELHLLNLDPHERQVRKSVENLRRRGFLICSASTQDGGYYMATGLTEFQEFAQREYWAFIHRMRETVQGMEEEATKQFGDAVQLELL